MLVGAITILACAVAFRLRGSELWDKVTGTGTTGGRILWSITVGLALWAAHAEDFYAWVIIPFIVLAFVGSVVGWPGSIDLGRNEGSFWRDFAMHSLRGAWFLFPASLSLLCVGGYAAAGLLAVWGLGAGIIYEAAWRLPVRRWFVSGIEMIGPGVPLGEALLGAWLGLGIVLSGGV